jgi:hypothetical protein
MIIRNCRLSLRHISLSSKTGVNEKAWEFQQKDVFIDAKEVYDNAGKRAIYMGQKLANLGLGMGISNKVAD